MFEFGRELKKLFGAAPDTEDLGWLELIGPELLAREARTQCTDAGRVSCAKPFIGWMRGAVLWREHARRTGASDSLNRAFTAAGDARRSARTPDETVRADIETALCLMARFDLCGGVATLDLAVQTAPEATSAQRSTTAAALTALHARLRLRQARLARTPDILLRAAGLMDTAIQVVEADRARPSDELRLERAALALEAGVMRRDATLLDQAGRELRRLVAAADPDRRPLARARALTLCAAGLSALAALAGDDAAHAQAKLLFEGAADQFTPDHSPLDWVAIQLARSATPGAVSLTTLRQAEALGGGQSLVLGALARDRRLEVETRAAETARDRDLLKTLRESILRRLAVVRRAPAAGEAGDAGDLDWAVDQIALARLDAASARLTGRAERSTSGFALFEAAEIARDRGVADLAEAAEALMPVRSINV